MALFVFFLPYLSHAQIAKAVGDIADIKKMYIVLCFIMVCIVERYGFLTEVTGGLWNDSAKKKKKHIHITFA